MKFHCDRCKKPYVIADERVRGKILKIRCKNCSAIITVREGMDQVGVSRGSSMGMRHSVVGPQDTSSATGLPRGESPGQPSPGPGHPGMLSPDDPPPFTRDPDLEPEWYLSVGGEQEGPYSLVDAKDWISGRDADVEVYCWRDGFDDWRLVEEVPFFQKVRRRRQSKLVLVPPPPGVDVEPERSEQERLSSQGIRPSVVMAAVDPTGLGSGELELEIDDEPSANGAEATKGAGAAEPTRHERGRLPGVADAPPVQQQDAPFLPDADGAGLGMPARRRSVVPLLLVAILAIGGGVATVLWQGGGDEPAPGGQTRAQADEADGIGAADDSRLPALSSDDIIRESSKSGTWFRRCFEEARARNPGLEVESLQLEVTVSPAGMVTEVGLSRLEDTPLGKCIITGVRQWRFRPSKAGIKSHIPLVFEPESE